MTATILFSGGSDTTIRATRAGIDWFGGEQMDIYLWIGVGLFVFGALIRFLLLLPPTDDDRPTVGEIYRRLQAERGLRGQDSTAPSVRTNSESRSSASERSRASALQPRTTPSSPDFVVHEPTA